MRVGVVVQDQWTFFEDIYRCLLAQFDVSVFKARRINSPLMSLRLNQALLQHDLTRFLRSHDVVYFEWASQLLAQATALPKQCPIVTCLHGYELYEWVDAVDWRKVDRVIVHLKRVEEELIEKAPECKGRTVVIPVGVDLQKFYSASRGFSGQIGAIAYFAPRKRLYDLFLCIAELMQEGYDLHFHIAGAVPKQYERDYIPFQRLPAKLGLQDRITFHGAVANAADWYHGIDVFVSHSYTETQHVALQEAMASGCLCLAHFWDGVEEFLPAEHVYDTNADLKTKLMSILDSSEDGRMAQQARLRSITEERFDLRTTRLATANILREVARS